MDCESVMELQFRPLFLNANDNHPSHFPTIRSSICSISKRREKKTRENVFRLKIAFLHRSFVFVMCADQLKTTNANDKANADADEDNGNGSMHRIES